MGRENPRKEINKVIQERLAEGRSKADIFKHLQTKFDDDKLSARLLAIQPSLELRHKYRHLNHTLLAVLVIITITKVLIAGLFILSEVPKAIPLLFLMPVLNIILIYLVAKFSAIGYVLTVLFGLIGLSQIWYELPIVPVLADIITSTVLSVPVLVTMVLAIILCWRLLPNTSLFLRPRKDKAGQYIF
jgi:hypothetical protein